MTNPPQVPQPGVPLPQGPPPRSSRALWWALGIILALLLLILAGGLFLASRFVRGITVQGPNQVELHTQAGEVNIQKSYEDNTGLPVYPGSTRRPEGAQIQFKPAQEEGGFALSAASYNAPVALDSVAKWYRKNLDPSFEEQTGKEAVKVGGVDLERADLAFVSRQDDRFRIVALEHRGDQTKITLLRMGGKHAQ